MLLLLLQIDNVTKPLFLVRIDLLREPLLGGKGSKTESTEMPKAKQEQKCNPVKLCNEYTLVHLKEKQWLLIKL